MGVPLSVLADARAQPATTHVATLRQIHLGMIDAVLAGGGVAPVAALAAEQLSGTVAIVLPAADIATAAPDERRLPAVERYVTERLAGRPVKVPAGVVAEVEVRSGDEPLGAVRPARRPARRGRRARGARARRPRGAHRRDAPRRARLPAPRRGGALRRARAALRAGGAGPGAAARRRPRPGRERVRRAPARRPHRPRAGRDRAGAPRRARRPPAATSSRRWRPARPSGWPGGSRTTMPVGVSPHEPTPAGFGTALKVAALDAGARRRRGAARRELAPAARDGRDGPERAHGARGQHGGPRDRAASTRCAPTSSTART